MLRFKFICFIVHFIFLAMFNQKSFAKTSNPVILQCDIAGPVYNGILEGEIDLHNWKTVCYSFEERSNLVGFAPSEFKLKFNDLVYQLKNNSASDEASIILKKFIHSKNCEGEWVHNTSGGQFSIKGNENSTKYPVKLEMAFIENESVYNQAPRMVLRGPKIAGGRDPIDPIVYPYCSIVLK